MKIYLYGLDLPYLNLNDVRRYIHNLTGIDIIIKDEFFKQHTNEIIAEKIAYTRVLDHKKPFEKIKISYDDIVEELQLLKKPIIVDRLYDGYQFQLVTNELLNEYAIHIILSNRYLCTFDNNDYRYHLRSVIFGYPDIISIPGIVEAPAKPKEYYLMLYKYIMEGKRDDIDKLKKIFKDMIIDYDYKINEVLKGLVLQIIKYHITGDPFCNNKRCKLYNAHWQEELISSQLHGCICYNDMKILRSVII